MEHLSKEEFRERVSRGDPECCLVFNSLNQIFENLDKSKFNSTLPNYLRRTRDKNWFNSMCLASLEEFYHLIYESRAENDSTSATFLTLDAVQYAKWFEFMIGCINPIRNSRCVLLMTFKVLSTMLADYKKMSTGEERLLNEKCSIQFVENYLVLTNNKIVITYCDRSIANEELEVDIFSYLADSLELNEEIWKRNFVLEAMKIATVILKQIRPRTIKEPNGQDFVLYHEKHFLYKSDCLTEAIGRIMKNSCKNKSFVRNFWNHSENRYTKSKSYIEKSSILYLIGIATDFLIEGGLNQEKLKTFIKNFGLINESKYGPIMLAFVYFISCSHRIEYDDETAKIVVKHILNMIDIYISLVTTRASFALNILLEKDTSNCIKRALKPKMDQLFERLLYLNTYHENMDECGKLYSTLIEMQLEIEQLT